VKTCLHSTTESLEGDDANKQEADIRPIHHRMTELLNSLPIGHMWIDESGGNSRVDLRHATAARIITALYQSLSGVATEVPNG